MVERCDRLHIVHYLPPPFWLEIDHSVLYRARSVAISACMDGTKALVRPIQEDETPCPGDSALSDFLIMLR